MTRLHSSTIPVFRGGYVWRESSISTTRDGPSKGERSRREVTLTHNLFDEPGPIAEWPREWREFSGYAIHTPTRLGEEYFSAQDGYLPSEFFKYYDAFAEPALFRIFATLGANVGGADDFFLPCTEDQLASMLEFCNAHGVYSEDPTRIKIDAYYMNYAVEVSQRAKTRKSAADDLNSVIEQMAWGPVRPKVFRTPHGAVDFQIHVEDLKTALWFQLAIAVARAKEFRACEVCGKPFEVSPEVNRKDRVTCSDACRSRAYRRRKARAIELRAGGKKLREIAKAVGSDMKTIKGWLQQEK
jgi:predicted nucleic acid-binding Zn ribbon protein